MVLVNLIKKIKQEVNNQNRTVEKKHDAWNCNEYELNITSLKNKASEELH